MTKDATTASQVAQIIGSARREAPAPETEYDELVSLVGRQRSEKEQARFEALLEKDHAGTLAERPPAPRRTRDSVAGVGDRDGAGITREPTEFDATDAQVRQIRGY